MTNIGSYFNGTIRDTKGATDNSVTGNNNNVRYAGDNGANTFNVGGFRNNVQIENIGRDERIQLEGRPQDWQQVPDANARDGRVTFVNNVTGNTVTMATDACRNDQFVKSKISFTGNYASLGNPCQNVCSGFGGWQNLGNMAMNPGCFNPSSYMAGYMAGRQSGYAQGANDGYSFGRSTGIRDGFWGGAAWGSLAMLPFRAWSCF